MGKPKTDRTQQLHEAARRYTLAQQANAAIEQHSFDKLIRQGTVVMDRQAEQSMLISEGRTVGKPPPQQALSTLSTDVCIVSEWMLR